MLNKILKGIIAFVLLSSVYIIYMGTTNKEATVITEVEMEASPAEVYEILSSIDRTAEWLTGLKSIELIRGEEMAAGSKYRLIFLEGGKDVEMTETLTEVVRNERLAFDLESSFMSSRVEISLKSTEEGTLLREINTYSGKDFVTRAMASPRNVKQRQKRAYMSLKDVVEK